MKNFDYILIGGGAASAQAAVAIRELDESGSILIICGENRMPYDRPPLSKNYLIKDSMTPEDPESKDASYYVEHSIEVLRGQPVESIDRGGKKVRLEDGTEFSYGKLLIATGSSLILPPFDSPLVFSLKTVDDAEGLRDALRSAKHVAITGAGLTGIEVAAVAIARGCEVTIIDAGTHLWRRFASADSALAIQTALEAQGVKFLFGDEPSGPPANGSVTTKGGIVVKADLLVHATGATLNTGLAGGAGLRTDSQEGIEVNEYLQTSDGDIYVAGDIAALLSADGTRFHTEHHLNAKWQGRQAGRNMAGAHEKFVRVPYGYSDFFDLHMATRGITSHAKPVRVIGDQAGCDFIELYTTDGETLSMGLLVSRDEPKLDRWSETLEGLIAQGSSWKAVTEEHFMEVVAPA